MTNLIKIVLAAMVLSLLTSAKLYTKDEGQQQDYIVFRTVLTEKEGRIDLHLSKDSVEIYLDKLKYNLKRKMSLLEQYKLYSSTLEKIHCGHTQIIPSRDVQAEWLLKKKALPFDMYLVGRRLVVGKVIQEDYKNITVGKRKGEYLKLIAPGSEILSIDHLTVEEMMERMGNYISSDEGTMDFKYFQAAQMFDFYHHLALPLNKDSIHVRYVTPDQEDTNVVYYRPGPAPVHSMNARLSEASQDYTEQESDFGKFKIVKGKYGYFRFHSFAASIGKGYDEFLSNSFKSIKRHKIDKIIVDLRGNTGGIMQYDFMKYMVGEGVNIGKYIISKPKSTSSNQYIKKCNIHYLRHALLSGQQKRRIRKGQFDNGIIKTDWVDPELVYDGEVVVITDEGTFSSAAILACQLKTLKNAKIAGRPAGGSFYGGNAGTLLAKLPQSGFKLSVNPNTYYSHLERAEDPSLIKQPDVYLNPMILDQKKLDQFYFKHAVDLFK